MRMSGPHPAASTQEYAARAAEQAAVAAPAAEGPDVVAALPLFVMVALFPVGARTHGLRGGALSRQEGRDCLAWEGTGLHCPWAAAGPNQVKVEVPSLLRLSGRWSRVK
jgi:hypothetical protein